VWGCFAAIIYPKIEPRLKTWSRLNLWLLLSGLLVFAILLPVPGLSLVEATLFPALLMSTASAGVAGGQVDRAPVLQPLYLAAVFYLSRADATFSGSSAAACSA
jgi:hypothetical protein